jgi:hypothetical protein
MVIVSAATWTVTGCPAWIWPRAIVHGRGTFVRDPSGTPDSKG